MLKVEKTDRFLLDLDDIALHIAQDNLSAAVKLEDHIHQQVDSLADPNFPRRTGRIPGTLELVAHPNYLVVLQQTDTTVTALTVMHVARQYP
jgi:plasmid stabilization system protein ParE